MIRSAKDMEVDISLAKIHETEVELAVHFPALFKARMSSKNGGQIDMEGEAWWLFPFRNDSSRRSIRKTAHDICRATDTALHNKPGFPSDGIAVAHNGAGDLLLLRRSGERLADTVWVFRFRGGEVSVAFEDFNELWGDKIFAPARTTSGDG